VAHFFNLQLRLGRTRFDSNVRILGMCGLNSLFHINSFVFRSQMRSEDIKKEAESRYKLITEIYESVVTCVSEIARKTSISRRTVSRYIRLWKSSVPVEDVKANVRPPKITPKNRSFIASEIAKKPFISGKELQLRLLEQKNVKVFRHLTTGNPKNCPKPPTRNRVSQLSA